MKLNLNPGSEFQISPEPDLFASKNLSVFFNTIPRLISSLGNEVIEQGNRFFQIIESEQEENQLPGKFFHFELSLQLRSLLLLIRDIQFEVEKSKNKNYDGSLTKDLLKKHKLDSMLKVQEAFEALEHWQLKKWKEVSDNPKPWLKQWKLQNNPWPVYQGQISRIIDQTRRIELNANEIKSYCKDFKAIVQAIHDILKVSKTQNEKLIQEITQLISMLETDQDHHAASIKKRINQMEADTEKKWYNSDLMRYLSLVLDRLPRKKPIIIDIQRGYLVEQEVDLQRKSVRWLESEVYPIIFEILEFSERMDATFILNISNIRNRFHFDSEAPTEIDLKSESKEILHGAQKDLKEAQREISQLAHSVETKLEKFRITDIYNTDEPFLPQSIQKALSQLSVRRPVIKKILNKLDAGAHWFSNLQRKVAQEEERSIFEKFVHYSQSLQPDPANQQYSTIFTTKGYLGSSFAVGRKLESKIFNQAFQGWEEGYRGSILLYGTRCCGKSFFGDWILNQHISSKKIVKISPNTDLEIRGRKITTTYNLSETLDFVKKFGLNERFCLWLDDLEYWQSDKIPLYQNLDALLKFIDSHSSHFFIVASINTWSLQHWELHLNFKNSFHTLIDLSKLTKDELFQAVLVRHSATYKKIVREDGNTLLPRDFKSLVKKIAKYVDNNIGEVFIIWTSLVKQHGPKEVMVNPFTPYMFSPSFSAEQRLLLKQFILFRKTDELMLSRQFGPVFYEKYSFELKRMLGSKLLIRQLNGSLELDESIANLVAKEIFK